MRPASIIPTVLLTAAVSTACSDAPREIKINRNDLEMLKKRAIYFGHQSVGVNILDGVTALAKSAGGTGPKIVETDKPEALVPGVWAHAEVGKNKAPSTKLTAFKENLDAGFGERADIAFLKLCFIDIDEKTDTTALFEEYRKALLELKEKYPKTTFLHMTVPLTTVASGPKAWLKRKLGRNPWGDAVNVRRGDFNDLIRGEYPKDRVFDIATVQSTLRNGDPYSFTFGDREVQGLVEEYTYDGGHLNEEGQVLVASELIRFLSKVPPADSGASEVATP